MKVMKYFACAFLVLAACGKKPEHDKRFLDLTAPYVVPNTYDEAYKEIERMTNDVGYYVENPNLEKVKEQIDPLKKVAAKLHDLAKTKDLSPDEQRFVEYTAPDFAKAVDQLEQAVKSVSAPGMKAAHETMKRHADELKKCYGHRH